LHCAALPQPFRSGSGRTGAGAAAGLATGSSGCGTSRPPKMLDVWLFDCVHAASSASPARPAIHTGPRLERGRLGFRTTTVRCQ
jgi:hypothetical protein